MSVCIELKVALRCNIEATLSRGSGMFKFVAVNEVVIALVAEEEVADECCCKFLSSLFKSGLEAG